MDVHASAFNHLLALLEPLKDAYQPVFAQLRATTYSPEAILKCFAQLVARQLPSHWSEYGETCRNVRSSKSAFPHSALTKGWLPPAFSSRRAGVVARAQQGRLLHLQVLVFGRPSHFWSGACCHQS